MSALQEFMDELDYLMEKAASIDVFQLPMDAIENLEVEPICSVFSDESRQECYGLHYILKVTSSQNDGIKYCRITCGDGGLIIAKSDFTLRINELLTITRQPWTYF